VRVALACPYAWEAPGGVQVHVVQLARALRDRGHEVIVLAPGSCPAAEPWVRIVGRPLPVPYNGTVAPICFSAASSGRVRAALARFAPDVLHAHEPLAPSTSMLAVRASSVPVVATFHAYQERSRLMELAAPALRTVWRRIDAAIAVSGAAAAFLGRVIRGDVEIVPNGIDVDLFADPGSPAVGLPPGRRVLWVNRLDPQKGFRVMVRAFAELAMRFEDLSLVVAGDGRDRDAVASLPEPLRGRVVLLGSVPHDDLPAYHAAADVFASPAVGQESFGLVLVEAMAAGVPVVAADIPGYREVVRDGIDGLLVRPRDPRGLAGAIARVLEDQDLAGRLSEAGRARADEYSWARVAPRIEAVYERVASGPHAPG
jgi:phosphatidyl-myo-inositol alpha-mannosyltransferase